MNTHLRRLGGLTVAAALMVSLSACSNDKPETFRTPTATGAPSASGTASGTATGSPTATATPEPTTIVDPDTNQPDYCKSVKDFKEFTGAAADTFGAENVKSAYCFAGNFALNQGFTNLMDVKKGRAPVEFSFVKDYVTPSLYADWQGNVKKALKGDETGSMNVNGLTGYGMESAELKFDKDAPRVSNPNVSQAATSVDTASGSPRLAMRFTVTADVIYRRTSDGKLVAFPYTKDTTFWMVPNGDKSKPWLIDGYEGAPSGGEVRVLN